MHSSDRTLPARFPPPRSPFLPRLPRSRPWGWRPRGLTPPPPPPPRPRARAPRRPPPPPPPPCPRPPRAPAASRHAAAHDAEGFLRGELERRRALGYPPYGQLTRVVCSSEEPGPDGDAATSLGERLRELAVPALGPAPLFRRQGRHRTQLVVKSSEGEDAIAALREAVESVALPRGVS